MQHKSHSRFGRLIEQLECRRLLSAGSLDASFSSDGKATSSFDPLTVTGNAVAVESNGTIVEVGRASDVNFAVTRFNADGSLDTSFGPTGTGRLVTHVGPGECSNIAYSVAVQSDGKIIIGGLITLGSNDDGDEMFVVRLNTDGSYDNSFNGRGLVTLDAIDSHTGSNGVPKAIAIQNDGKILVAGSEYQGAFNNNDNFVIVRFNTNGTLDDSFGSNGGVSTDLGQSEDAEAMAIDYNGTASTNSDYGKIVLIGHQVKNGGDADPIDTNPADPYKVVIARYNTNGSLDKTFNGSGVLATTAGDSAKSTDAEGVAIESGGAIVIAGSAGASGISGTHKFFLARFTSSGALDKTFGTNGNTTTSFGANDVATSMVIGGFGQQLIVGGMSSGYFALSAYSLNGVLDQSFGINGQVLDSFSAGGTARVGLALAPNHTIVAAGGPSFETARYFDIGPDVSVISTDPTAGPTTTKRVGKISEVIPNNATLTVSRDENLNVATRVYFTLGGTALPPNATNIKLKKANYTLSGMTIPTLPTTTKTAYVDIPAGQTSVTVTLTPENIPASNTTATFTVSSNALYDSGSPSAQTITILGTTPSPPPTTTTLADTADAYVQDGSDASDNFGTSANLEVKEGSSGVNRISYLTFNLASLGSVNSVKLNLFGELSSSDATNIVTQLFSVATTSWSETGITYNNKPSIGSTVLGSATIANTTPAMYTIDVTSYVKAQLAAGNKTVSFALKNPSGGSPYVMFNSKEAGGNVPTLTVT